MDSLTYLGVLLFIVVMSWWLEWAFKIRVLRKPGKLGRTVLVVLIPFSLWDAYAIAEGHWFFDYGQMTGLIGPLGVPLEEYLFFVVVPIAIVLTWEGVTSFLRIVRRWWQR
jgi:lycopene cyclase domain-containing protein